MNHTQHGHADIRKSVKRSDMHFCFSKQGKLLNYLKFGPDLSLLILFYFLYTVLALMSHIYVDYYLKKLYQL